MKGNLTSYTIEHIFNSFLKKRIELICGTASQLIVSKALDSFDTKHSKLAHGLALKQLSIWWTNLFQGLTEACPDKAKKLDVIKYRSWNEYVYKRYEERFLQVQVLLEKQITSVMINREWLEKYAGGLVTIIRRTARLDQKNPDWEFFRKKLLITDNRWLSSESLPIEKYAEMVLKVVKREKPRSFGPTFIFKHLGAAKYNNLRRRLRGEKACISKDDWAPLINLLPGSLRKLWKYQASERTLTFDVAVKRIVDYASLPGVKSFSPLAIVRTDPHAYYRIRMSLPKKKNKRRDWTKFVDLLPKGVRQKWDPQESWSFYERYYDDEEFAWILKKNEDNLYTIICYSNANAREKALAEKLVREFIFLAQNGNMTARDLLLEFLQYTCQEWVIDDLSLSSAKIAGDKINNCILSSIYNFDRTRRGKFFNYLLVTLRYRLKEVGIIKEWKEWKQ